jgi:hypothetical protein
MAIANPSGTGVNAGYGGASPTYRSGIKLKRDKCFSEFLTSTGGSTPFLVAAQQNLGVLATGVTVANLPASPAIGQEAVVTNANAPAWGVTVAGGGAAFAKVVWNGTNWTVMAK